MSHKKAQKTQKEYFKTLGQYALVVALCLLILTWVMQLWRADLTVPFAYFGDSLLYSIAAKGTIELPVLSCFLLLVAGVTAWLNRPKTICRACDEYSCHLPNSLSKQKPQITRMKMQI